MYAIGSNERAAALAGVRVNRWKLVFYGVSGMMAGLAGLVNATRLGTGIPSSSIGLELAVITAVILGGASLLGGQRASARHLPRRALPVMSADRADPVGRGTRVPAGGAGQRPDPGRDVRRVAARAPGAWLTGPSRRGSATTSGSTTPPSTPSATQRSGPRSRPCCANAASAATTSTSGATSQSASSRWTTTPPQRPLQRQRHRCALGGALRRPDQHRRDRRARLGKALRPRLEPVTPRHRYRQQN